MCILTQGMSKSLLYFCIQSTIALLIIILEPHLFSGLISAWLLCSVISPEAHSSGLIRRSWQRSRVVINSSLTSISPQHFVVGTAFFQKLYSEPIFCLCVAEQVTICATISFIY